MLFDELQNHVVAIQKNFLNEIFKNNMKFLRMIELYLMLKHDIKFDNIELIFQFLNRCYFHLHDIIHNNYIKLML